MAPCQPESRNVQGDILDQNFGRFIEDALVFHLAGIVNILFKSDFALQGECGRV